MRLIPTSERPSLLVAVLDVLATLASVAFWFLSSCNIVHVESDLLWMVIFFSAVPFYYAVRKNKVIMKTLEVCVCSYLAVGVWLCAYLAIWPPPGGWHPEPSPEGASHTLKGIGMMVLLTAVEAAVVVIVQTVLARFSDFRSSGDR